MSPPFGTRRAFPPADQRIHLARSGRTLGDRRPGGLPGLAQPSPGADLGLLETPRIAGRRRGAVTHLALIPEYRTIWISDLHLGTRGCKAEFLLDFLRYTEAETIYLVGDIIDGWRLKKSWYWPQEHNDVIQKVLRKVRKGTRVIYVPGNHDEWLRDFTQMQFGGVEVVEDAIHVTGRTAAPGDSWRCVRRGCHARPLAGIARRRRPYRHALAQPLLQHRKAPAWISVLVAVGLSKAAGQERHAIHRLLCRRCCRRSSPPRCRRRGLRSHPPCRTA